MLNHAEEETRAVFMRNWLYAWPLLNAGDSPVLLVAGWPLARTIWFSLTNARPDEARAPGFVGLANDALLVTDPDRWNAVRNTVVPAQTWGWVLHDQVGLVNQALLAIGLISGASSFELLWGRIMAASVIVTVPLICWCRSSGAASWRGLTAGAVKG